MEEDVLKDELAELTDEQVMLENVPIMIRLLENTVLGAQGAPEDVIGFINTVVLQLAILFSYDEVKLVFLMEEKQLADMGYIKYLPHVWDDQRSIRFIATNASEAYQVGEYLQKELEKDLETPRKWDKIRSERPYYIVITLSKKLLDGVEIIKRAIEKEETIGLSLITGFPDVPKECSIILELNKEEEEGFVNNMIYVRELDKEDETFVLDDFDEKEALSSMRVLANTKLRAGFPGLFPSENLHFSGNVRRGTHRGSEYCGALAFQRSGDEPRGAHRNRNRRGGIYAGSSSEVPGSPWTGGGNHRFRKK